VQLDALKAGMISTSRVTLEARVLDEDYRPSERPEQSICLTAPDGSAATWTSRVPERPGLYRANFDVERQVSTPPRSTSRRSRRHPRRDDRLQVTLPRAERDPRPIRRRSEISNLSHGKALDLAHVDELLAQFPGHEERREPISSELDDAWDQWGTLLLALALLSTEWILRKRWDLI
jgi:hypothetical protein